MRRRQFLRGTGGVLASAGFVRCYQLQERSPSPAVTELGTARYTSQDQHLLVDLEAAPRSLRRFGRTASLLAYNQQVPGPLWEVAAGDAITINFANRLEQPTNLHFHGLHIPPTGSADNVFLSIPPGENYTYQFALPSQHPGGLFWYHPHHHGQVAAQVFGGLAGPLLVRGAVDEIPEIQAAQEFVLVLQDFDLLRGGKRLEPPPIMQRWGRQGRFIAVNGDRAPDIAIPHHGLLRLRLLNASASRIYRLQLANHPWFLIGSDGGTLSAPIEIEKDLVLAPGERADLLVPGDCEPGTYALMSRPYDRGISTMMSGLERSLQQRFETVPTLIAQLRYGSPTPKPVSLPTSLMRVEPAPPPSHTREFVLDHGIDGAQAFLINGQGYEHHRIDTTVQLDTTEDWLIVNKAGMDHPFHVHTNAFQIVERNGQPVAATMWKDVVNVKAYEQVRLRISFQDYSGKTVYHCHILDHEDQGMMGILDIQPVLA